MRLLLAEDEADLSRVLQAALKLQGYEVDAVYDGEAAVTLARQNAYDCMVFDIMMPKLDGLGALRQIRAKGLVTPVLLLTAKAELDDRVTGLDAGADDYLTKPFAIKELLARIRSITRRQTGYTSTRLTVGGVTLDVEQQELSCRNDIRLSHKETKLMELFMRNEGKELSSAEVLRSVWAEEKEEDPAVCWMYVCYLREKLVSVGADLAIEGQQGGVFRLVQGARV